MGAETRLAVVLFGSLVLWIPALSAVLRGELDAGVAAIRFGVGAALVWVVVAGLNQLITGYAVAAPAEATGERARERAAERRRRADDLGAEDAGDAAPEPDAAEQEPPESG